MTTVPAAPATAPAPAPDLIGDERFSPLGGAHLLIHDAAALPARLPPGAIHVAVDRAGALPAVEASAWDAMVTIRPDAPAPWVSIAPARLAAQLAQVRRVAGGAPIAAALLARLLRIGEGLAFEDALELESLAYSTLLGGGEFARWRAARPRRDGAGEPVARVRYDRADDVVTLTLASPDSRNAMTAAMRDALFEALANVLDDPTRPRLILRGEGRCFSTGGHLPEFGSAGDLAEAHVVRMMRGGARLLHRLGDRAEARLHGACIGSGLEVPAAAARRIAAPDLIAQLPELTMGLIPGAGGTVSVARAIGRHRTLWLALGAFRMGADTARAWGLVHAVVP